jgi:hypothetical protein
MPEIYNNKLHYKIGEELTINDTLCVCSEVGFNRDCSPCVLISAPMSVCKEYACNSCERLDGKDVIFIKKKI